jgi:hypothetical protein
MYADQRAELLFRRERQHQIFTWSGGILVAIAGWALVAPKAPVPATHFGVVSLVLLASAALVFSLCASAWQLKQRVLMSAHQRALADLAEERGWFAVHSASHGEPIYPLEWRKWGRQRRAIGGLGAKFWATIALGVIAFSAILMRG